MDNCILLSICKNWAAAILSGEKRLEIRKCAPSYNPNTEKRAEYPLRVVMYETKAHGGAGAVVGFFDCPGYPSRGIFSTARQRRLVHGRPIP